MFHFTSDQNTPGDFWTSWFPSDLFESASSRWIKMMSTHRLLPSSPNWFNWQVQCTPKHQEYVLFLRNNYVCRNPLIHHIQLSSQSSTILINYHQLSTIIINYQHLTSIIITYHQLSSIIITSQHLSSIINTYHHSSSIIINYQQSSSIINI